MSEIPAENKQALQEINWEARLRKARARRESVLRAKAAGQESPNDPPYQDTAAQETPKKLVVPKVSLAKNRATKPATAAPHGPAIDELVFTPAPKPAPTPPPSPKTPTANPRETVASHVPTADRVVPVPSVDGADGKGRGLLVYVAFGLFAGLAIAVGAMALMDRLLPSQIAAVEPPPPVEEGLEDVIPLSAQMDTPIGDTAPLIAEAPLVISDLVSSFAAPRPIAAPTLPAQVSSPPRIALSALAAPVVAPDALPATSVPPRTPDAGVTAFSALPAPETEASPTPPTGLTVAPRLPFEALLTTVLPPPGLPEFGAAPPPRAPWQAGAPPPVAPMPDAAALLPPPPDAVGRVPFPPLASVPATEYGPPSVEAPPNPASTNAPIDLGPVVVAAPMPLAAPTIDASLSPSVNGLEILGGFSVDVTPETRLRGTGGPLSLSGLGLEETLLLRLIEPTAPVVPPMARAPEGFAVPSIAPPGLQTTVPIDPPPRHALIVLDGAPDIGVAPLTDPAPPAKPVPGPNTLAVWIFAEATVEDDVLAGVTQLIEKLGLPVRSAGRVDYRITSNQVRFYDAVSAEAAALLAEKLAATPRDFVNSNVDLGPDVLEIYLTGDPGAQPVFRLEPDPERPIAQPQSDELDALREKVLSKLRGQ